MGRKIIQGTNAFETSDSITRKDGFNNEDFILTKYGHGRSGGPRLYRDGNGGFWCLHCHRSSWIIPDRTQHPAFSIRDRGLLPRIRSFWNFYKPAADMLLNESAFNPQTIEEKCHDH
jgi:hypothetical protein